MAHAEQTPDHDAPHEGPIKTPKQLIYAVAYAFIVPIIGIILLANFVAAGNKPAAGSDGMTDQAIALRIAPVARPPEVKDVSDLTTMKAGNEVFAAQCSACHATGAAGAPKVGDAAAWGPRVAQGFDTLLHSALKGKGAMTPQSGGDFSDFEIARAVVYMANQGGGKFAEPAAPAASAAAGDAPSAASAPAAASAAATGASAP